MFFAAAILTKRLILNDYLNETYHCKLSPASISIIILSIPPQSHLFLIIKYPLVKK